MKNSILTLLALANLLALCVSVPIPDDTEANDADLTESISKLLNNRNFNSFLKSFFSRINIGESK